MSKFSQRLRQATWRPLSEESRLDHLSSIESAVDAEAARVLAPAYHRRRFPVMALAAALVILPTGIAFAAENAIPGDVLYPIKRVTESVRSWVDDDVVAEHRVEELERLVAADAPDDVISDQIDRATREVNRLDGDSALESRILNATPGPTNDRVTDTPPPPVRPGDGRPVDTPSETTTGTTAAITDGTTVTSTPIDRPTTTTTATTLVDKSTTTIRPDVGTHRVFGYVHAGPTCPVVRFPPDPDCADQPVPGAALVVTRADGTELTRVQSNAEGRFEISLPDGPYLLVPRQYDGLLGTAPAQEFVVDGAPVELDVAYDTGIR